MIRLIIDTSAGIATSILSRDTDLIGATSSRGSVLELLHGNVQQGLDAARLSVDQIDEVCVVTGPGSWTGLHVGVTTAKTIAQYLKIPLVEISILDAMAYTLPATTDLILAVFDARRDYVYSACYRWREETLLTLLPPAKRGIDESARLATEHDVKIALVGDHARKSVKRHLKNCAVSETGISYPSPQAFITLANYKSGTGVSGADIFDVVPDYMGEDFTITPSSKVIR
jgi:tRNA threonylcarbamoyladenosine biosynthesis protein TsaB